MKLEMQDLTGRPFYVFKPWSLRRRDPDPLRAARSIENGRVYTTASLRRLESLGAIIRAPSFARGVVLVAKDAPEMLGGRAQGFWKLIQKRLRLKHASSLLDMVSMPELSDVQAWLREFRAGPVDTVPQLRANASLFPRSDELLAARPSSLDDPQRTLVADASGTLFDERPGGGKWCGMSNQGATCYMNSVMQALFHTPEVRAYVYRYGSDHPITLELQRLFARMQMGERPFVDTKALTTSFGWTESDAFEQQDAQELLRVLFEALDLIAALTDTPPLTALYRGSLEDYTTCSECHSTRSREDPFFDLQLPVRGLGTLEDSIRRFCEPEQMRGENRVSCPTCGRATDSLKGLRIKELPRLLTLQLKRFDFDPATYRRVKINTRLEYPAVLDLSHIVPGAPKYNLFAVMLHSGGAMGGHYQAFVRADSGCWIRCNDSSVVAVPETELAQGFGGPPESAGAVAHRPDSTTSAYMLMYRSSDCPSVEVVQDMVPEAVRAEIEAENDKFRTARAEWRRRRDTLTLRVSLGAGSVAANVQIHKDTPLAEAKTAICAALRPENPQVPEDMELVRLRYWKANAEAPGEAYTDTSKTIGQLGFHSNMALFVEVRQPGADFPVIDDSIRISLLKLDAEGRDFCEPHPEALAASATVGDLRALASAFVGSAARIVAVVMENGRQRATVLSEDAKELRRDLGVADGSMLYAEDASVPEESSRLLQRFDEESNRIDIGYNKLNSKEPTQHMIIDGRKTVGCLKNEISKALGVPEAQFRLCNSFFSAKEYTDPARTMAQAGLFDGCNVAVVPGAPSKSGEIKLAVFLYSPDAPDAGPLGAGRFGKLPDIPVTEDTQVGAVAAVVASSLQQEHPGLDPSLVRVRSKIGPRVGQLLAPTRTLRDCLPGLRSGKEVAVQLLSAPDVLPPSGRVLILEVERFDPDKNAVGPRSEVVLDTDATIGELQSVLASREGLARASAVAVAKPPRFLQEPEQLREVNWHVEAEAQLRTMPLNCTDGDLVVFCESVPESWRKNRAAHKETALRIDIHAQQRNAAEAPIA
eukprot:m51a1_g2556 putative peptidase c19 family ubiquitinyl hydrolase (1045) ;mRNA; f:324034-328280